MQNTPKQDPLANDLERAYRLLKRVTPKPKDIQAAGDYLASRRQLYPNFLEELVAAHRELNMFTLSLYADVGDGKLYAPYVIYTSCASMIQKIAHLPLKEQKTIYDEGVDVLVGNETVRMMFYDVTPKLSRMLWDGHHMRTVEEQRSWRDRPPTPRLKLSKSRYTVDSKSKTVRIGNVTLFKTDLIEIAKQILNLDDLLDLLTAVERKT